MDSRRVFVDISDLPPPEPLAVAMASAEALPPGQYLQLHHWREPLLLYDRLTRNNFCFDTRIGEDDSFEVFIWRLDDPDAREAAKLAASQLTPLRG